MQSSAIGPSFLACCNVLRLSSLKAEVGLTVNETPFVESMLSDLFERGSSGVMRDMGRSILRLYTYVPMYLPSSYVSYNLIVEDQNDAPPLFKSYHLLHALDIETRSRVLTNNRFSK